MYDQLPGSLKKRKQFCNWRREQRNDRMTKVPYRTNGKRANPTDPKCFTDFDSVCAVQDAYDGIGIGIFGDLFAIDIDHCVADGVVSEMAQDIIDTMNCYTEYSPSGTGIRILGLASGLNYDKARYYINNQKLGLEVYVAGYTNKFVTLTGNAIRESDLVDRGGELVDVLEKYMVKPAQLQLVKRNVPGSYTVDFLTKTMKVNEGEVPQYYVEDSHPAIIKPEEWEAVQVEMEQRRSKGRRHDCSSPFSGKIFCGDCGSVYGSKTWHSTDKYRRVIWQCNHKYDSGEKCGTPHLREEVLKDLFVQALGQYMDDPDERLEGLQYVQRTMTDTTFVDADLEETEQRMDLLSGMIRNCIMLNASATVTEREYRQQYEELTRQYEELKAKHEELQDRRKQMNETAIIFGGMLFELWELENVPVIFEESLWHTLVDHATVHADERIVFHFKDGTEIATML